MFFISKAKTFLFDRAIISVKNANATWYVM